MAWLFRLQIQAVKNDVEIEIVPRVFPGRTTVIPLFFSEIPHLLFMQ